jgi:small multidrug resistance family-3 protein
VIAFAKTLLLFVVTASAEILGCYLPYLWLLPAAASLAAFVWLLSLHPTAAGRTYAAYGGVYVVTALLWLWAVERIRPTSWDLLGGAVAIAGMAIIALAPR